MKINHQELYRICPELIDDSSVEATVYQVCTWSETLLATISNEADLKSAIRHHLKQRKRIKVKILHRYKGGSHHYIGTDGYELSEGQLNLFENS